MGQSQADSSLAMDLVITNALIVDYWGIIKADVGIKSGRIAATRSDLLVINKIDLAPHVGASLEVMDRDARKMRGERPFVFTNMKTREGLGVVMDFIIQEGMLG